MKVTDGLSRIAAPFVLMMTLATASQQVGAQTPAALPTGPDAAQKTVSNGPPTAAKASLPGPSGSPLEPYLYLFLLVGSGIIGGVTMVATDRRVRASR